MSLLPPVTADRFVPAPLFRRLAAAVYDVLPLAGARELARALGDRATLHELPGRTHFDLWPELQRLRP